MTNIFYGKTNDDCLLSIMDKLKANYQKGGHHIFIVPDRMSVICEKMIFDHLGIESTCNIEVLTLSRLASKILGNMNVISKASSCMILQKCLKNMQKQDENKLKCFKWSAGSDIAQVIYGAISQFKSCKVGFENMVVTNKDKNLEDKLSDISLLYKEYQKTLKERNLFDSMDRLDFLPSEISKNSYIKNACFYVSHFDSFTYQGYAIVGEIMKHCREFNIGITFSDNPINSYIYNEDYRTNISNIAPKATILHAKEQKSGDFKVLQDNLYGFSLSPVLQEKCDISLFEGKNLREELIYACSTIKTMILEEGLSFKDFFIAVPNLQSKKSVVEKVLKEFDFSYYLDTQEEMKDSLLVRFLNSFFEMIKEKSSTSVLTFVKQPLCSLEYEKIEDFEDYILKYNLTNLYEIKNSHIDTCSFYVGFDEIRNYILSFEEEIASFEEQQTYGEFAINIKKMLKKMQIEAKIDEICQHLAEKGNLVWAKMFEQYYDKYLSILDNITKVLGDEQCSLDDFVLTASAGISSCKISTTPLSVDAVFVGDSSASFYEARKVGFVTSVCEDLFPKVTSDCGIITDKDIQNMSERYKLEPIILQINKKERFKAYELLLKPQNKLFLSYNFQDGDKGRIVTDLQKLFCIKTGSKFEPLPIIKYANLPFEQKNVAFSIAKSNLISNLRSIANGEKDFSKQDAELYDAIKGNLQEGFLENFSHKNKLAVNGDLFFKKGTTSVSEVESFMSCPFKHFAQYGLKLGEKEQGELGRNNIGVLMHALAENLYQEISLPAQNADVIKVAKDIFDEEIKKEDYITLTSNSTNNSLIENLRQEGVRLALALNNQAELSAFKPKYFELKFDKNKEIKGLKIHTSKGIISLVGKIDRLDIFKDYFRIIDYKTGTSDTSLKELFFGKKIQLEAYLKAVQDSLHLRPAGAYYLPVKNTFEDKDDSSYSPYGLKGRTIMDDEVVCASDKGFMDGAQKSRIVQVRLNKPKGNGFEYNAHSMSATKEQFDKLGQYAFDLITKACQDVLSGDITPCPIQLGSNGDDSCKHCPYKTLCRFDTSFGNYMRVGKKKDDINSFCGEVSQNE